MNWPFVRGARLAAAETGRIQAEAERDTARAIQGVAEDETKMVQAFHAQACDKVRALEADNDNLRATVANLTAACEHHVTAHGTLLRMLAQVQMTMLNMPYWASKPAQETQEASHESSPQ